MTGTYSFSVDVPEHAATEAVTISAEANENEQASAPVTDAQAETDVEAVESESAVSPVIWLLGLAAAAGVAFLLMKKRR